MRTQRIGPFDLEVTRPVGGVVFRVELRYSEELLCDWGSFDTEDAAIACGVKNLKLMCEAVLEYNG